MNKFNIINILGFNVFSDDLTKIMTENKIKLLTTISPNSYGITTKDNLFDKALKESDILVLDGVYFALASLLLKGKNIKKNQGPDVYYHFMERMNKEKGKVFFLGSSQKTLENIKQRANLEYPDLSIDYFSPPYKEEFTKEENDLMINSINSFSPDVLFVGMTCPKQEKWAYFHKELINTKLICCIGGVFDWYAGNYPEISPIWWKLRLAWLKRMIDRPEIFRRNMPNILIFIRDVFLVRFGFKKII